MHDIQQPVVFRAMLPVVVRQLIERRDYFAFFVGLHKCKRRQRQQRLEVHCATASCA
jgi:hypothetical protein